MGSSLTCSTTGAVDKSHRFTRSSRHEHAKKVAIFVPQHKKMDVTIGGCEVNFILTSFHRLRLVGGLEYLDYFSIRLGISYSQLMKSYFSEGWLNHQPDMFFTVFPKCC